jgi:hypothetical protein
MLEKEINDYTRDAYAAYGLRPEPLNPAFWERVAAEDERQATAANSESNVNGTRPPPFNPERASSSIHSNSSIPCDGAAVPVGENAESSAAAAAPPPRSGTKSNPPRAPRYYSETRRAAHWFLFRHYSTSVCVAVKQLYQATARTTSRNVARIEEQHHISTKCKETAHRSATIVKQASLRAKQKTVSKAKYTCRMLQRQMKRASLRLKQQVEKRKQR